jgi:pilus assembly protein CpaF
MSINLYYILIYEIMSYTTFQHTYLENLCRHVYAQVDFDRCAHFNKNQALTHLQPLLLDAMTVHHHPLTAKDQQQCLTYMYEDLWAYGPLTHAMNDPNVQDIFVNGPQDIALIIDGQLVRTSMHFRHDGHLHHFAQKLASRVGHKINHLKPLVDAKLNAHTRINITFPPISGDDRVYLSIRKLSATIFSLNSYVMDGTLTQKEANLLTDLIHAQANILIAGNTGAGKTTLLNTLAALIPTTERVILLEDTPEINLPNHHYVSLQTRLADGDMVKEVNLLDLVKNALRMRPDRLIVGEVRGAEAFALLQAMSTGHKGSLTTIHSNGPLDALLRLKTMVRQSGLNPPADVVSQLIARGFDYVVYITRTANGQRTISDIHKVADQSSTLSANHESDL